MTRDTEDMVALIARLRSDARGADAWRAMDEAADRLQSLSVLERALKRMVYEASHLSPIEDDGSHWCKISYEALAEARAALHQEGIRP